MASGGDLAIYKWSFSISSSSEVATTTSFGLYAYTDSGFSLVDSAFTSDGLINYGNCINGENFHTSTAKLSDRTDAPSVVEIYPDKGAIAYGCNATTTYVVADGATRYFAFKATVANVESTASVQDTFSVALLGDAAYPVTFLNNDEPATAGNMFKA